jgi:hypothetical protein
MDGIEGSEFGRVDGRCGEEVQVGIKTEVGEGSEGEERRRRTWVIAFLDD